MKEVVKSEKHILHASNPLNPANSTLPANFNRLSTDPLTQPQPMDMGASLSPSPRSEIPMLQAVPPLQSVPPPKPPPSSSLPYDARLPPDLRSSSQKAADGYRSGNKRRFCFESLFFFF